MKWILIAGVGILCACILLLVLLVGLKVARRGDDRGGHENAGNARLPSPWGLAEMPFDFEKAEKVIGLVRTRSLSTDAEGVVVLPPDMKSVSLDGKIYVTVSKESERLYLFVTWKGKGANLRGWLYATLPLTAADIGKDAYGENAVSISVPIPLGPPGEGQRTVMQADVQLERQLSGHWCRVLRSLD